MPEALAINPASPLVGELRQRSELRERQQLMSPTSWRSMPCMDRIGAVSSRPESEREQQKLARSGRDRANNTLSMQDSLPAYPGKPS